MLLRRVIEHVKAQNWTAVFLDFVIVVMGVFIGIQVSNWNDALGEKADEAGYLAALESDAIFSTDSIRTTIESMRQAQDARRALYEYNVNPDAQQPEVAINQLVQGALFNIQRLNVRLVAFEALTSSGRLSLIGDPELPSELQALDAAIELARRWEQESIEFTYEYSDPYLLAEADTENLMIASLVGDGDILAWIKGNEGQSLSPEQLKSVKFKNLLLYQADISRGRLKATEACLRQYEKVLSLIKARQEEIGG